MAISIKKRLIIRIIDALILLLHITYGMSMLKVWLLDPIPMPYYTDILLITLIVYLFRFGLSFHLFVAKHNGIVWLFLILYVADVFQNFLFNVNMAFTRLLFLIDVILFMEYVYSLYLESTRVIENPLEEITRPYEWYIIYNVVTVILCLVLIYIGVISQNDNPIYGNSLINSNVSTGGQYYFPGHLSLALGSQRGLSLFNLPVLTGLSHEPHVLFLLMGPCFFILLNRAKKRPVFLVILYVTVFFMLIVSTSTTAIISFIIVFIIEQLYNIFIGENKFINFLVLFIIIGIGVWFMSVGAEIIEDVTTMMDEKMEAAYDEGSKGFSLSMLKYVVSPKSIIGRGNMPEGTGFLLDSQDVGFITCVLDLFFVLFFVIRIIKSVVSSDRRIHYLGMALLYFFIHNLKMGVQSFSFQYISFFVVLVVIIDNEKERMKQTNKIIVEPISGNE